MSEFSGISVKAFPTTASISENVFHLDLSQLRLKDTFDGYF